MNLSYTSMNRHIVLCALFYFPLVFIEDHSLLTNSVKENVLPFIPGRHSYFCSDPDAEWQLYCAWVLQLTTEPFSILAHRALLVSLIALS